MQNAIKGNSLTKIIFDKSESEYIINAYKDGIPSDNLIQFKGGKFAIFFYIIIIS